LIIFARHARKERANFINRQIDNIAPEIVEAILLAPVALSG